MTYNPCPNTFNDYPCSWEAGHPQDFHYNRTMRMSWTAHWPIHTHNIGPNPAA